MILGDITVDDGHYKQGKQGAYSHTGSNDQTNIMAAHSPRTCGENQG